MASLRRTSFLNSPAKFDSKDAYWNMWSWVQFKSNVWENRVRASPDSRGDWLLKFRVNLLLVWDSRGSNCRSKCPADLSHCHVWHSSSETVLARQNRFHRNRRSEKSKQCFGFLSGFMQSVINIHLRCGQSATCCFTQIKPLVKFIFFNVADWTRNLIPKLIQKSDWAGPN